MIKRIALLLMAFWLSLPATVLAAEAGNGKIEGQLVNGTAGGSSVANQEVTLTTYLNDAESGTKTAQSDADGRFVFDGLSTDSGYSYEVKLNYQEADYTGERLSFAAGESVKSTELKVYDSTSSDAAVKISAAHTLSYPGEGSIEVVEYLIFTNDSDRSYVGSGEITPTGTRRTLKLPLPEKTTELQYGGELMSCCVLQNGSNLSDTMAVLPGEKLIAYSYKVNYSGEGYTFSRKVDYPVASHNVLVQGEETQVNSNRLMSGGLLEMEGDKFNTFGANDLAPGETLDVQLSNLPRSTTQMTVIWVALTLAVLAGGFGLSRRFKKGQLQPVPVKSNSEQERQKLLVALAKLDDDFESGKVQQEVYQRQRAEKKSQLVTLERRPKESRGRK